MVLTPCLAPSDGTMNTSWSYHFRKGKKIATCLDWKLGFLKTVSITSTIRTSSKDPGWHLI